jgi:hypothetical protein
LYGTVWLGRRRSHMNQLSPEWRRRARPLDAGLTLEVHIDDELLEPLDRWMAANPTRCPSRPAAVRHALREWLIHQGVLQPHDRG